jgi:hypothetical protein
MITPLKNAERNRLSCGGGATVMKCSLAVAASSTRDRFPRYTILLFICFLCKTGWNLIFFFLRGKEIDTSTN